MVAGTQAGKVDEGAGPGGKAAPPVRWLWWIPMMCSLTFLVDRLVENRVLGDVVLLGAFIAMACRYCWRARLSVMAQGLRSG